MNRVSVIGPGALGCLFAGQLEQAGVATSLVDYSPVRADLLREAGITIEQEGGTYVSYPEIVLAPPADLDLVIVLTKAYSTAHVVLPPATPVLTLQNGLGNAEILEARCGAEWVLAGATWEAVTWLAPGRVRHIAPGRTLFGPWQGCPAEPALALLHQAGFDAAIVEDTRAVLWQKMIVNAAINPLAALLGVKNGLLLDTPESISLLRVLTAETAAIARAEGYPVPCDIESSVERACEATRGNISSMLQDIRNGRRTEIDAISGEILRRAAVLRLPATQTALIYHLVRALETI